MSEVFDSIMNGLGEALDDAKGKKRLTRKIVAVAPVKVYNAEEIKKIRRSTGFSQKAFAQYLGVSCKTVEAWEAGVNHPAGSASRILDMMSEDEELTKRFPFVKVE